MLGARLPPSRRSRTAVQIGSAWHPSARACRPRPRHGGAAARENRTDTEGAALLYWLERTPVGFRYCTTSKSSQTNRRGITAITTINNAHADRGPPQGPQSADYRCPPLEAGNHFQAARNPARSSEGPPLRRSRVGPPGRQHVQAVGAVHPVRSSSSAAKPERTTASWRRGPTGPPAQIAVPRTTGSMRSSAVRLAESAVALLQVSSRWRPPPKMATRADAATQFTRNGSTAPRPTVR